ncbi:hypothetical protein N7449_011750 [Penicillium cf. viridicatum]|uniref:Uncharacterized protein n=1 Tax=Penicillium cf. viridicatum TaxID=2972119 RepID=A0A9W9IM32_9EURO|nr:hypothetical protein N7449_011750 [Penicillium cf. viridicatum]
MCTKTLGEGPPAPSTPYCKNGKPRLQRQHCMSDHGADCRTPASSVGFRHKRAGSDLLVAQSDGSPKYGTGLG